MKTTIIGNGKAPLRELLWIARQQVFACIFGILLLAGILATRSWNADEILSRQDFLFLYALGLQGCLIAFRLENKAEFKVILAFHVLATLMEWFKTSPAIGSWQYPGEGAIFRIYQVPLFAGFLYSAVGSYIARSWRLFDIRFEKYPPISLTVGLASLAYLNFFTHHYTFDIRWLLTAASILLFGKTKISFLTGVRRSKLPLLPVLISVAFSIWIAENIGTYARAWIYPGQESGWTLVSIQKFWAWYLLMMLSFVLVSLLHFQNRKPKSTLSWAHRFHVTDRIRGAILGR